MPYTTEYLEYYKSGHEDGTYSIRAHKVKGLMFPDVTPRPFRENIPVEYRSEHKTVDVDEMNAIMIKKIAG